MSWEGERVYVISATEDRCEWTLCLAENLEPHLAAAAPSEPITALASFKANSWEEARETYRWFQDGVDHGERTLELKAIVDDLFTRHAGAFRRLAE